MTASIKTLAAMAFIVGQCLCTVSPASAAELEIAESGQAQFGSFAGARFRVELGGRKEGRARLAITLAPAQQIRSIQGRQTLRYGDGLEFGLTSGEPASLSIAGMRFVPGGPLVNRDGKALGITTLGAAGIVAGVIVLGGIGAALVIRSDSGD